jgi:hypothetical protein
MNLEELAQRVAALEAEIGVLRQEAAAARALAAGADRDVADYRAELRGHTRTTATVGRSRKRVLGATPLGRLIPLT